MWGKRTEELNSVNQGIFLPVEMIEEYNLPCKKERKIGQLLYEPYKCKKNHLHLKMLNLLNDLNK